MNEWSRFHAVLRHNGWKNPAQFISTTFIRLSAIVIGAAAIGTLVALPSVEAVLAGIVFLGIIGSVLFEQYVHESRVKEFEDALPDLLFGFGMQPKNASVEKMIGWAGESLSSPLVKKEWKEIGQEIRNGAVPRHALEKRLAKYPSPKIEKTFRLVLQSHDVGGDFRKAFIELGNEFIELKGIDQEKKALLFVQKYTLLASAGLMIPFCLGLIGRITSGLDLASIADTGLVQGANPLTAATIQFTNQVYIFEFAVLSGVFVALLEGCPKKAVLYVIVLAPAAFIVFHASKMMAL